MPGPANTQFDRSARWDGDEPQAAAQGPPPPGSGNGAEEWQIVAPAIGLSVVGVVAPVAVGLIAATNALPWRPLATATLVGLLLVAPLGAGIAAALLGLRRVAAALRQEAAGDAAQAVLRVLVAGIVFGYTVVWLAATPLDPVASRCLAVAAFALVIAWGLLLCVMLWPVASMARRYGGMILDVAAISVFLHTGGASVAGWYPLYAVAVFHAGLRFGLRPLLTSAAASLLGFAAVVVSTAAWRRQPALAAGLIVGLGVLPGVLAGAIRGAAAARAAAARAEAERQRTLRAIAQSLRGGDSTGGATLSAAAQLHDILDFAAIEAGTFASPLETFDLRALVLRNLQPLQAKAAESGVALYWRVDPRLPYRMRGQAETLGRILCGLAEHAIEAAQANSVRLTVGAGPEERGELRLDLRLDGVRAEEALPGSSDGVPLQLRLVQRLTGLAGGTFAIRRSGAQRARIDIGLPLAAEAGASAPPLDLGGRPVVIVTEDEVLARDLAEPLGAWNAEPRWSSDADDAFGELVKGDGGPRPIAILDGRDRLLSALGLAHRASRLGTKAPFVLLIAEETQLASLAAVEEGELDGFIPMPVTEPLLAKALYALPLAPHRPGPRAGAAVPPPHARATAEAARPSHDARVTPIAAHPKFAQEAPATLDPRSIEGLRALGGGDGFIDEVLDSFRIDARQIMGRLEDAAAAADRLGFAQGLVALRRAAGHLGGAQLCELTASLQHVGPAELRQNGVLYTQQLEAEIDRLSEALTSFLATEEERRKSQPRSDR